VFPVHSFATNGCSCGKADQCRHPGKHPRTRSGHNAATIDPTRIRRWWSEHPDDNIGIATGPAHIVVIDIDERHDGLESWAELEAEIGSHLCDTATVLTGGGGEHRYFEAPDRIFVPSSAGQVGIGIDVRAHGGYVIAPPSTHASGKRYEWIEGTDGIPIPLPDRLLELLSSPVTDVEDARLSELPSQTYVWLIEQSKPRKSGEPSRPGEDLLRRWMAALGMSESDVQRIRELAGYFGEDAHHVREMSPRAATGTSTGSASIEKYGFARDEGIQAAVDGAGIIVHCAGSSKGDDEATRNLVRAGAQHLV
jgi:Bifunctional DNA primase/polymerase, N-terminal